MRVPIWAPVLGLGLVAGAWGWIEGSRYAALTETDAIEAAAERYLAQAGAGARRTDCHAVPGRDPGVWLEVRCGVLPWVYDVDRRGRVRDRAPGLPGA